jgi:nucleoid-associated protein YgaU
MRRLLMATALAAAVVSALSAAAALLQVDGGTLQVFEYPAADIGLLSPIDGCGENCAGIEWTAQNGGNPAKHLPASYEIGPGDTLMGIAESTAEDGEDFAERLPASYEIRPGDTLSDIAARFGTTVEALVQLNGVQDPNVILYGSTLSVPDIGGEVGGATVGVSP